MTTNANTTTTTAAAGEFVMRKAGLIASTFPRTRAGMLSARLALAEAIIADPSVSYSITETRPSAFTDEEGNPIMQGDVVLHVPAIPRRSSRAWLAK